jgi:hypothetical protein
MGITAMLFNYVDMVLTELLIWMDRSVCQSFAIWDRMSRRIVPGDTLLMIGDPAPAECGGGGFKQTSKFGVSCGYLAMLLAPNNKLGKLEEERGVDLPLYEPAIRVA